MAEPNSSDGNIDRIGREAVEGRSGAAEPMVPPDMPAACPHAQPSLVEPGATPGTGSLPSRAPDGEADAATG